ncbi:MAG: isoprenylcysteine carboxylmethyltransferase family protein [Deltaproteobacteria bacterium]|nr:MAG: isoprenylcysteine carboxylmethyltransferase family protein [Deltaproteobacteria bacterium]
MQDALLLVTVVLYVLIAFLWPTVRLWRHHGVWPIVFSREAAPAQRLLGWLTRALLVLVVGASAARLVTDPEDLAIWGVPGVLQAAGWLLVGAGLLLTVVAQHQMGASWRVGIDDRPTALVDRGVFRLVRNPIFTGLLAFLAGYACLTPAWWSVALWLATAAGLRLQVVWEERHLAAQHGATYLAYAARVGRFVPGVGRLTAPAPTRERRGRPAS